MQVCNPPEICQTHRQYPPHSTVPSEKPLVYRDYARWTQLITFVHSSKLCDACSQCSSLPFLRFPTWKIELETPIYHTSYYYTRHVYTLHHLEAIWNWNFKLTQKVHLFRQNTVESVIYVQGIVTVMYVFQNNELLHYFIHWTSLYFKQKS